MAYEANPFTPTFGVVPTIVAERKQLLTEMQVAFEQGSGNPKTKKKLTGLNVAQVIEIQ